MHARKFYRHVADNGESYILSQGVGYRVTDEGYTERSFIYTVAPSGSEVLYYTLTGTAVRQTWRYITSYAVQCCYRPVAIAVPEVLRRTAGFRFGGYQAEVVDEPTVVLD